MDRFGLQTSPRIGRGDTGEGDCPDYRSDNESLGKNDGDVAQGVRAKGNEILSNYGKKLGRFGSYRGPGSMVLWSLC